MVGIYLITNKLNGKSYVGQSIDIKTRWSSHKSRSQSFTEHHDNMIIHAAMQKYGIENFSFEVLEECSPQQLDEREKYWIAKLNTITPDGYNILPGGQGLERQTVKEYYCKKCGKLITRYGASGLCLSCVQLKVERPSKEELYKILIDTEGNFTAIGRKFGVTDNAIRKWCDSYGLPRHSSDYKKSKAPKQFYKRAVHQIDIATGNIIATYESANEAARAVGKSKGNHIIEVCQGKNNSAYGYNWEYADIIGESPSG